MNMFLKIVGIVLVFLILLVGGYVAYVYIQYHRLPDKLKETVKTPLTQKVELGKSYSIETFNIGYGSYPNDYTFFMDGGKEVIARSVSAVNQAIDTDADLIAKSNPDFATIQEIDWQGHRSRGVDEPKRLLAKLKNSGFNYSSVLTQNYDSAWLQYPVFNPIGKAKSGILTLSKYQIDESMRYSLPIDTNFSKFFDLDRAFDVNILPITDSEKHFVLINTHLSAYTKNAKIQKAQLAKIFGVMQKYVEAGDYVICGGDYNHDLVGKPHNELTWMKTFPTQDLTKGMRIVAPNPETNSPSVRSNGVTLTDPKEIFGWIDGFLVSNNIKDFSIKVIDNHFASSDHQPVLMQFQLNK